MNPPTSSPDPATTLNFESLVGILGSVPAWKVLRVLADGSSLLPNEIAEQSRLPNDTVRKQLNRMREAGLVIAPRVKLYEIPPQFLADKTERVLDFGYCVLRLKAVPTNHC
jgi:DNA-binding transcriptional ArsR family regulator